MPIFPDNHAPVISNALDVPVTVSETTRIYLGDKVTDADNMDAAIVKSAILKDGEDLITARVWRDSLIIIPIKTVTADTQTTFTLKVNSNGQVVIKNLTVKVKSDAVISHPVTGITVSPATAEIAVGQTLQLTATVAPDSADDKAVTWMSSQPLIASVDSNGVVTVHSASGTVYITATTHDGGFTDTCAVTTLSPPFILNNHQLTLNVSEDAQLSLTEPEAYTVNWRSLDENIAIVSSTGMVTGIAAGITKIIAEDTAKNKADSCTVTIRGTTTEIEQTSSLSANVYYTNGSLRIINLDGYVCSIFATNGQKINTFQVKSPEDTQPVRLLSGIYILVAQKDEYRKTFKFVVIFN
jgi:uncharacterized protein YjdB